MRRSSLAEMKDFLVRIVGGKVEPGALDSCKQELETAGGLGAGGVGAGAAGRGAGGHRRDQQEG